MEIRHIYMADDDQDDYYLFSIALKQVNDSVQISWFATGKDLLLHLDSDNNRPDLILLDMNMPINDGQYCLQKIKEHPQCNSIPVVILSTASSPITIKKAYDSGAAKYLLKPNSIEEYAKVIQEILAIPKTTIKN